MREWIMASGIRRAAVVAVCLWIAGIVAVALWKAHSDWVDIYSGTMLALLLVGVPAAVACIYIAASVAGRKIASGFIIACVAVGVALAALAALQKKRIATQRESARQALVAKDERLRGECEAANPGGDRSDIVFCMIDKERRDQLRNQGYSEEIIDRVVRGNGAQRGLLDGIPTRDKSSAEAKSNRLLEEPSK